jgi:hypothetical protein
LAAVARERRERLVDMVKMEKEETAEDRNARVEIKDITRE